ncbi:uncharacterized protein LOC130441530 [Diorhabda sublineata]|uniref:uncharacterized protein LOC130441530 n=1 Tax=Diorhabda sublineata TaxID=1163346 RepID=UPI0024E134C9|nr:uncharacterized protein LOC130441530 [Diorhabda sublineata]
MANFVKTLAFLTTFVIAGLCQSNTTLICYDCDPSHSEECKYPVKNNAANTVCKQIGNTTAACLSAYINNTDPTKTGIYRGCVNKPVEVADVCDWYIQEKSSANVTFKSCFACNETRCNTIMLYPDGSSSANNVYNLNIVMIINTIILISLVLWK